MIPKDHISASRLARLLGIDTRTLKRRAERGAFPFTKDAAGNFYFSIAAVNKIFHKNGNELYKKQHGLPAGE